MLANHMSQSPSWGKKSPYTMPRAPAGALRAYPSISNHPDRPFPSRSHSQITARPGANWYKLIQIQSPLSSRRRSPEQLRRRREPNSKYKPRDLRSFGSKPPDLFYFSPCFFLRLPEEPKGLGPVYIRWLIGPTRTVK
jgi:hypothetical protein